MKARSFLYSFLKSHPEWRYTLFLPAFLLAFFLMERLVPAGCDYWVSYCPLDDRIPFLEGFVVPYCLWYPLLFCVGVFLLVFDVPGLKKYVLFMSVGFGFSIVFCILFPNGQDLRPAVFPRDNIFTRLLECIYAADTNTNVLPSMHVIGSVAAALAAWHSKPMKRWRFLPAIAALLASISTVFVKQHSVLDIFAGLAVCVPLWFWLYRKKE